MAYDDAQYLRAIEELDHSVAILLDNEITPLQIHEAVDTAIENAEAE